MSKAGFKGLINGSNGSTTNPTLTGYKRAIGDMANMMKTRKRKA